MDGKPITGKHIVLCVSAILIIGKHGLQAVLESVYRSTQVHCNWHSLLSAAPLESSFYQVHLTVA